MSGPAESTRSAEPPPNPASSAATRGSWISDEDLLARQDRLEEAARLVGRLAHDFGNVLTGILGFSELGLSLLSPDSPAYQYTHEIHQAAQEGAEFTLALRWFSRRGCRGEYASSLTNAVAVEARRLEQKSGGSVQWRIDAADELPLVWVEEEALRVMVRQVLANAHDASPGGGSITLTSQLVCLNEKECRRLLGDARPGNFVQIAVADSGAGLSAEARRHLFIDPFFSSKPRRRGLGLAIVYGILRNCQGGMRIEDGAAGGAIVRLFVPVAAGMTPAVLSVQPAPGNRVLVVDDDPGVLLLVCTTLQQAGYRVQAAADGAEALDRYTAAGSEGFALVLSDVFMPHISGIDLARRLLAKDARANVLLMSGEATSGLDLTDPLNDRFDLLSKPFRPEGLLRAVRAALQRRSLAAQGDVGRTAFTPHRAST
jgi:CheY-like chemotaxis protein